MAETVRKYNALVSLSDPRELGNYVAKHMGLKPAQLTMDVIGIDVLDLNKETISSSHPFTGRAAPKMVPEKAGLTWTRTDYSELHIELYGNRRPPHTEWFTLTNGLVEIDPLRIRGENHSAFNREFGHGTTQKPVSKLMFKPDRTVGLYQFPVMRESSLILPMLARLTLLEIPQE